MASAELIQIAEQDIARRGLDEVAKEVWKPLRQMVANTKAKQEGVLLLAEGFDCINPNRLEEAVQYISNELPDGELKANMQSDLTFWRANRAEIMDDHNMRPAPEPDPSDDPEVRVRCAQ